MSRERARFLRADAGEVLEPAQESVVLIGPPDALTGNLALSNRTDRPVAVRDLKVTAAKGSAGVLERLGIGSRFLPNGAQSVAVSAALPEHTAPGEYLERVAFGGREVSVRLVVQPRLRVEVNPSTLHFVGVSGGQEHRAELVLTNTGNIPVQIPNLRHATALDVDTLCRNLATAVRDKGDVGSTATLDAFVKGVKKDMAGWIELGLDEAWEIVDPGSSLLLHLKLKLPEDVQEVRIYRGSFRLIEPLVDYLIVPAPSERNGPRRRAGHSSG